MKRNVKIPVFSAAGRIIGHVSQQATSIGASKLAGGPCEYSRRFGPWGWVRKGPG